MKRTVLALFVTLLVAQILFAESSKSDLLVLFDRWESSAPSTNNLINFGKVKSLLTSSSVLPDHLMMHLLRESMNTC